VGGRVQVLLCDRSFTHRLLFSHTLPSSLPPSLPLLQRACAEGVLFCTPVGRLGGQKEDVALLSESTGQVTKKGGREGGREGGRKGGREGLVLTHNQPLTTHTHMHTQQTHSKEACPSSSSLLPLLLLLLPLLPPLPLTKSGKRGRKGGRDGRRKGLSSHRSSSSLLWTM